MAFFEFPHTRTYDTDLGWLIKAFNEISEKLDTYLENAVIKFADPITWDITEQYTALTCVIDSDGTAYLSKQPVPAGVDISNTDYWLPIFNYDDNINQLRSQIAYNARTSATTGQALTEGDLVFWNGVIYLVTTDMAAGTAFIDGTNITPYTVDEKINDINTALTQDISDLNTNLSQDIYDLDTRLTQEINDLSAAVSQITKDYHTPEDYGAVGDGITSDTDALVALFADGGNIYIPEGKTYAFWDRIPVVSNSNIWMDGTLKAIGTNNETSLEFFDRYNPQPAYSGVHDVKLWGSGVIDMQGNVLPNSYAAALRIHHAKNINVSGITIKNYSKFHAVEIGGSEDVVIDGISILGCYPNGESGVHEAIQIEYISSAGTTYAIPYDGTISRNVTIKNCTFGPSAEGGDIYCAIGIHSAFNDDTWTKFYENILIENNLFLHNVDIAIQFDSNVKNLMIRNNEFRANAGSCSIHLVNLMKDCYIVGNEFRDNAYSVLWLGDNSATVKPTFVLENVNFNDNIITEYNTSGTAGTSGINILGVNSKCNIVNNVMKFDTSAANQPMYLSTYYRGTYTTDLTVQSNVINGAYVGRENILEHSASTGTLAEFLESRINAVKSIVYVQGVSGIEDKSIYQVFGSRTGYYDMFSIVYYNKLNNRLTMLSLPQPTGLAKMLVTQYNNGTFSHYEVALATLS